MPAAAPTTRTRPAAARAGWTSQPRTPERSTLPTTTLHSTTRRPPVDRRCSGLPPVLTERSRWRPPTPRQRAGGVSPTAAAARPARRRRRRAPGHGRSPAALDRRGRQDPAVSPARPLPERPPGRGVPVPGAAVGGGCRRRVGSARWHTGLGHRRSGGIQPGARHDEASLPTWLRRRKDRAARRRAPATSPGRRGAPPWPGSHRTGLRTPATAPGGAPGGARRREAGRQQAWG